MTETTVLVVTTDDGSRTELIETLESGRQEVTIETATSIETAIEKLDTETIDAVIVDDSFAPADGLALIEYVRGIGRAIGCILYTDETDIDTTEFEEIVVDVVQPGMSDADTHLVSLLEQVSKNQSQASYPLPADETQRLDAVAKYIPEDDTLARPFDRITQLAAIHFQVKTASINIIKRQTQECFATSGPPWPPGPRENSVCTHTIVHDQQSMAIEDIREDPRFAADELLEEAGIISYLGAKIQTPEGDVLGSLCVYHDQPRQFSQSERRYLETLADLLVDVLVLHRSGGTTSINFAQEEPR